jgi:ferredoxin
VRIWIDQSQCQNSGLCEEEAPALFKVGDDFFAYVRDPDGKVLAEPGGKDSVAEVPDDLVELAETCAAACPAQCIHLVD